MKLFSTSDIRKICTCHAGGNPNVEIALAEEAGRAIAREIEARWDSTTCVFVFAGPGGNGADALSASVELIKDGYSPNILLILTMEISPVCLHFQHVLEQMGYSNFKIARRNIEPPNIFPDNVIVDGLFGSGLSRILVKGYSQFCQYLNEQTAPIVSIDVPSGLFGEFNQKVNVLGNVVHASLTLALQFPRLAFFFAENARVLGEWKVLKTGMDDMDLHDFPSNYLLTDSHDVWAALKPRDPFSHKDTYGRLYLVAGSMGMMGAAVLSARAAQRTGVGVVSVHAPQCGYLVMQTAVPEALFDADAGEYHTEAISPASRYTVAIGPGIGTEECTIDALSAFLRRNGRPVVLDADALNCIARRNSLLDDIPAMSIITPHAGEFDRLFSESKSDEERFCLAAEMSNRLNIIIVLKGHYTFIFRPDGKVSVNTTGNAGMATAGSGDVLTGIIGGLLAQGYRPDVAATVGVYIHGLAGDMARDVYGEASMTASDIVDAIPEAFRQIERENTLKKEKRNNY